MKKGKSNTGTSEPKSVTDDKVTARISQETDDAVRAYAAKKGVLSSDVYDSLIMTGISRLDALARYAVSKKGASAAPKSVRKPGAAKKGRTRKSKVSKETKQLKAELNTIFEAADAVTQEVLSIDEAPKDAEVAEETT